MLNIELLAEIFGWIGVTFLVLSAQRKTGQGIIFTQGIGNIFATLHYLLSGVFSGAIVATIATSRNFLGYYLNGNFQKGIILLCTILPYILIYLTTNNFIGYLGATAAGIISLGVIFKEKSTFVRYSNFFATILWLIFAVTIGSLPMTVSNTIAITSIITGAIRHEDAFSPLRKKFLPRPQTA